MIIKTINPINNEEVEIEVEVTTNLLVSPTGTKVISVLASGSIEVQ